MRLDAIRRHVGMIGQMHFEKLRRRPDRDPLVQKTLEALKRRAEESKRAPTPVLFHADDFLDDAPPRRRTSPPKPANGPRVLRVTPKLVRRKRV